MRHLCKASHNFWWVNSSIIYEIEDLNKLLWSLELIFKKRKLGVFLQYKIFQKIKKLESKITRKKLGIMMHDEKLKKMLMWEKKH